MIIHVFAMIIHDYAFAFILTIRLCIHTYIVINLSYTTIVRLAAHHLLLPHQKLSMRMVSI